MLLFRSIAEQSPFKGRNALTQSGAAAASDSADALTSVISPESDEFSGFVFKLQANLDPKHRLVVFIVCMCLTLSTVISELVYRDRMAFIRVCSGTFKKGMKVLFPISTFLIDFFMPTIITSIIVFFVTLCWWSRLFLPVNTDKDDHILTPNN